MSESKEEPKISDPEEYAQTKRIEQILQSREKVSERLIEIEAARASTREKLRAYAVVVQNYVRNLEPLRQHYPEYVDRWDKHSLGVIQPVNHLSGEADYLRERLEETAEHPRTGSDIDIPDDTEITIKDAEPEAFRITGLTEFLLIPTEVEATATVKSEGTRFEQSHEAEVDVTVPIPRHVLDNAFREANLYLSDLGLTAEPEEGTPSDHVTFY